MVPTVNTSADKAKTQLDLLKQASGIYNSNNAITAISSSSGAVVPHISEFGLGNTAAPSGSGHSSVASAGFQVSRRSEFF